MRTHQTGHGWHVVSGFFAGEEPVRKAVIGLLSLGVPRDLIEVVIDEGESQRYFKDGRVRKLNLSSAMAGKGALTGLILLSFASAALIATSSATDNERLTWIMLLGPNIGVMLGGFLGLLWGLLSTPKIPDRYARLRERAGILLVVRTRSGREAEQIKIEIESRGAAAVAVH